MEFLIREGEQEPERVGDWFKQYVSLGYLLGKLLDSRDLSGLQGLLVVPNRAFVSAAICLGLSLQRYSSQREIGDKLSDPRRLGDYLGRRLRVELPGRFIVGDVESFQEKSATDIRLKFAPPIDSLVSLRLVKSITLLPAGFPVGTYDIESPDAYAPENPLKANIDRFMNQGAPSAIVFGHRNRMLEELGAEIQSGSFKEILGADFFKLIDIARFDYLSPRDQFPHFVNVLESTRQFPSDGSPEKTVMQMCELRVLDGNHAIDKLVLNDEMRGKLCLSIFELGDPTLSDQALAQFRASLLYSAPVEVDGLSTWTSPNGTSLSWWERQ